MAIALPVTIAVGAACFYEFKLDINIKREWIGEAKKSNQLKAVVFRAYYARR